MQTHSLEYIVMMCRKIIRPNPTMQCLQQLDKNVIDFSFCYFNKPGHPGHCNIDFVYKLGRSMRCILSEQELALLYHIIP
jgi:hypothetical protein